MTEFLRKNDKKIGVVLVALIMMFMGISFFGGRKETSVDKIDYLANYDRVIDGEEVINGTNFVTFDAFFLEDLDNDGHADGIRGNAIEIGDTKKLYLELKVLGDVKLKNGKIRFENSNVRVSGTLKKGSLVDTNQSSNDFSFINLSTLNNGLTVTKSLNVYSKLSNDLNSFTGTNKVVLTGTLTDLNGNELGEIEKEVSYVVDWYGDNLNANVTGNGTFNEIKPNNNPVVNYTFTASETEGQLFLKTFHMEGTVSQLNGRDPINVQITGSDIVANYDESTKSFTIRRDAVLENTLITKQAYAYKNDLVKYNDVHITVTYPYEETDEEGFTSVSVTAWYDAFNNQGDSFDQVKVSNKSSRVISASFVNQKPGGTIPIDSRNSVTVGSRSSILDRYYIDKTEATSIYNGATIENSFEDYNVSWHVYVPSEVNDNNNTTNVYTMMLDDNNGDKLNNSVSIKNYTKYKKISISNLSSALTANGTVSVINNDTDEVVHVFKSTNWNQIYEFDTDVKSVRLVVNGINYIKYGVDVNNFRNQLSFTVYMTKTIDNNLITDNIDQSDFELYGSVTSIMNMTTYKNGNLVSISGHDTNSSSGLASYINAQSQAYLTVSRSQIYTTEESDVIFTITTNEIDDISRGYKNGEFFILLPIELLNAKINSVTTSTDGVTIAGSSVGTLSDGRKYIKILTSNENAKKVVITVNAKLLPDPRKTDKGIYFTLYSYNPDCHNYRNQTADTYDINGNNDILEKVSYSNASMSISAPNEMITTSMITSYNSKGDITIAPMIAEVNPVEDDPEATVSISLLNNSEFSVKNTRIVGKVAYLDNTYQIGEGFLGSEYNVQMTDQGISYPDELEGKITLYYSEVENPTTDFNDSNNGWTLKEQTDFSKVKSYMVVFNDYVMTIGQSLTFTYDIDMPNVTANLNKVSYFNHGVYYDLDTESGLHASSVGGSKLGVRMSRQYDINLTNVKAYSTRKIDGTKYILTDPDGVQSIVNTNNNGTLSIKDLYVDKEYTLKQYSVKSPYVLDEEEKTIKIINNANDELELVSTGNFKTISLGNDKVLTIVHENEPRYNIVIKSTDLDTNAKITGTTFKITGKGYEQGSIVMTGNTGDLTLKGLYLNERYTVEEVDNTGYIKINDSFIIDVVRDDVTHEVLFTITKVPEITYQTRVFSGYCGLNEYSNDDGYYYEVESSCRYSSGKWIYSSWHIDLTGFKEQYELSYDVRWNDNGKYSYQYTWIVDDKSMFTSPTSSMIYNPSIVINSNDYNGNSLNTSAITNQATKYENNEYVHKEFVGGQAYDIVNLYYKNYSYANYNMSKFKIKPVSGYDEQVASQEKTNVPLVSDQNVLQSIVDSDNQDAPVLTVEVKNKKMPTYTLEVVKVDANTKEPLAGAQYKVTGPGLPQNGKYITTDSNGKATIELFKKYNYNNINDIDYSSVGSDYTIEEIVAPIGYSIDKKAIKFAGQQHLQNCTSRNNKYICDMSQDNITYIEYANDSEDEFKEYNFDKNTNTISVTLYDYPIVKITKKDGETGELLANTLFTIDLVDDSSGVRTYTPAKDTTGKNIGSRVKINGEEIYVIATDKNGNLNVGLPGGQYRLKEVQASDDKYEISESVYYFGIGETVPYQEDGIKLTGSTFREAKGSMTSYSYNDKFIFRGMNGSNYTKDGGYVTFDKNSNINKYSADGVLEWSAPSTVTYHNSDYIITYDDKPGYEEYMVGSNMRNDTYSETTWTPSSAIIVETTDGYYVALGENNTEKNLVIKIDRNGNRVWQSTDVVYIYKYYMFGTYDGASDPNSYYYRDEETHYASSYTIGYELNRTFGRINDINVDKDGNLLMFIGYVGSNTYENKDVTVYDHGVANGTISFKTYAGGFYLGNGQYIYANRTYNNSYSSYIVKYDKDTGKIVDAIDYQEKLQQALEMYVAKNNLTGEYTNVKTMDSFGYPQYAYIGRYDDGSLLLKVYATSNFRYNNKNNENISYFVKIDKDYNVVYLAPVALNGSGYGIWDNNNGTQPIILNNETGGFTIQLPHFYFNGDFYKAAHEAGSTRYDNYDNYDYEFYATSYVNNLPKFHDLESDNLEYTRRGSYIVEYNGAGEVDSATLYMTYVGNPATEYIYGDDILGYLENTTGPAVMRKTSDDKYIIATDMVDIGHDGFVKVRLKDGSMRVLELPENHSTFVVMKIDKQGKIEWLKDFYSTNAEINSNANYTGITANTANGSLFKTEIEEKNGKLIIPYRLEAHATVYDRTNNNIAITNNEDEWQWAYLEFELSDEVSPDGPEAYTLEIVNNRKEFKIKAESNAGGTITAKPSGTRNVISTDGELTTLETIKYGDNSSKDITITPDENHVIKSITINNNPVSYSVDSNGSVSLKKISNVTSDQNLRVTYEAGKSQVVVHHYKEGTTTSVFSDDILIGESGKPYTAEPHNSDVYSIVVDENGEPVLPSNMEGNFTSATQTVTFYYKENDVVLKVNYYLDGTDTELYPSVIDHRIIGTDYETTPQHIEFYELTRVLGSEKGTLTRATTEVTYMYRQTNYATITTYYKDKATDVDLIEPIVQKVLRGSDYQTSVSSSVPVNYRLIQTPVNASGPATTDNIDVIYYYEKIPFNISVNKTINRIVLNGNDTPITDYKSIKLDVKNSDEVIIYYQIEVINDGDLKATYNVVEKDITNFIIYDLKDFSLVNNTYQINAELDPGEAKKYLIAYKWNQKDYGVSENQIEVKNVSNSAGFKEYDASDNISTAKVELKEATIFTEIEKIIPNTADKLTIYITLLIMSFTGLVSTIVYVNKKRMR